MLLKEFTATTVAYRVRLSYCIYHGYGIKGEVWHGNPESNLLEDFTMLSAAGINGR
jgi:hypothetical protein